MEQNRISLDSTDLRARLRQPVRRQSVYQPRSAAPQQPVWTTVATVAGVTAPAPQPPVPVVSPTAQPAVVAPRADQFVAPVKPLSSPAMPLSPPQRTLPAKPVYRRSQPVVTTVPLRPSAAVVPTCPLPHSPPAPGHKNPVSEPFPGITIVKPVPITHANRPRMQKSDVLLRDTVAPPAPHAPRYPTARRRPKWHGAKLHLQRPSVLYAMAGLVFFVGMAVSLNGVLTNRHVSAQIKQVTSTASASAAGAGTSGKAAATPPSTDKISTADMAGYVVSPNLPRYIDIPRFNVHARVQSMGVTTDNRLQAPGNVYDAGWYNASAQPGQPGGMLIDGHVSSWTTHGVFYDLNKLVIGDKIIVTRGDGKQFTYRVVKQQMFDADSVDMGSLLDSKDSSKPGLNLITCSGQVVKGTNEFDRRLAVYAVMD